MRFVNIAAALLVLVAFSALVQSVSAEPVVVEKTPPQETEPLIGGDKDAHGCVATAGYLWNEEKQECVRPWEEDFEDMAVIEHDASNGERKIAPIAPAPILPFGAEVADEADDTGIIGGDTDEHGCIGTAGYTWCEAKQKCLRTWEEACNIEVAEANPFDVLLQAIAGFFNLFLL